MSAAGDLRASLARVEDDRAYLRSQRELLNRMWAALDREERLLRQALHLVGDGGQAAIVDVAGHAIRPQSQPAHRIKVLRCVPRGTQMAQADIAKRTGLDTGAVSRAVRDLEIAGDLRRVGVTTRRSPVWERVQR